LSVGRRIARAAGLLISIVSIAGLGFVAACGGGAPPSERLVNAEAAIRGAIEINANASPPRAALHLQLAQEQVDKAKRYIADGLNQRAELSLRQAQADAELAIALARNEEMNRRAAAARAKVDRLRSGKSL
jgi:uncharacterized protein YqfA (UPF0365 family)